MLTPIKIPTSNLLDADFYTKIFLYKKAVPAVGQGGFVIQLINHRKLPIQIIYDCGASPICHLIGEISKLDPNIYTILVLSHLHRDHINGIKQLKSRKINIRKVILPHVEEHERILSAADMDDNEIAQFIIDPKSMFDAHIIYVSDSNHSTLPPHTILSDVPENGIIPHELPYQILPGRTFDPSWMVKFYTNKSILLPLSPAEIDLIHQCNNLDAFLANKNKLKDAYHRISNGNHNKTSMLMFVFPRFQNALQKLFPKVNIDNLIMCTGDMQITEEVSCKIQAHYQNELDMISNAMIPHHGSKEYFIDIPFPKLSCCFLQAGKDNQFKHPDANLIEDLKRKGLSVTERII